MGLAVFHISIFYIKGRAQNIYIALALKDCRIHRCCLSTYYSNLNDNRGGFESCDALSRIMFMTAKQSVFKFALTASLYIMFHEPLHI